MICNVIVILYNPEANVAIVLVSLVVEINLPRVDVVA
jgi:hypothetical protein